MKCDRCRELLSWYLESDLRPEEMEEVAAHLSVCKECAEELQLLEETLALARELPQLAPPAEACAQLRKKVRAAVERKGTHYIWQKIQRKGRIETFVRDSEQRIPSAQRIRNFHSWHQILKQSHGTWWGFYAEANS